MANTLWVGTRKGLVKYVHNNNAWHFDALHSICLNEKNKAQMRIAISCGSVWESNGNGQTWEPRAEGMRTAYMPPGQAFDPNIQDPHCLQHSVTDPNNLWVQHHNGIFHSHSTDGSKQWQEIEQAGPSTFGFAVAVHPQEPNTAWFVPGVKDECRMPVDAKLVVTRTRDGGKRFEVLDKGLPRVECALYSDAYIPHPQQCGRS